MTGPAPARRPAAIHRITLAANVIAKHTSDVFNTSPPKSRRIRQGTAPLQQTPRPTWTSTRDGSDAERQRWSVGRRREAWKGRGRRKMSIDVQHEGGHDRRRRRGGRRRRIAPGERDGHRTVIVQADTRSLAQRLPGPGRGVTGGQLRRRHGPAARQQALEAQCGSSGERHHQDAGERAANRHPQVVYRPVARQRLPAAGVLTGQSRARD